MTAKDEDDVYVYELYAVVSHIRDGKQAGHLVAHLKAGEPYHLRKESVTCTQWYLINDFSITPVEKVIYMYMYLLEFCGSIQSKNGL